MAGLSSRQGRSCASALLLAVALSFAFPAITAGQMTLTTREMTALPPAAANQFVRKDLLSVLKPHGSINLGMMRRLRAIGLTTQPYGTEFEGLCGQDEISLMYVPTNTDAEPSSQPLLAYGVQAHTQYHTVGLPKQGAPDQRSLSPFRKECDTLEGNSSAVWFQAENATVAAEALNFLQAAADQVKAGALEPRGCSDFARDKRSCNQNFLEATSIAQVSGVETCSSGDTETYYAIDGEGSIRITIVGQPKSGGLVPAAITSITLAQLIVVT